MGVISFRELARENTYKFGEPRRLKRRWVCTLDNPETPAPQVSESLALDLGVEHPEYTTDRCIEIQLNEQYEGSRYHVEVVATYGLPDGGNAAARANPLERPPVWSFQTQGAAVPALSYWHTEFISGQQVTTRRPLTNSAFDFYQGMTTDEAQTKVLIKRNLPAFLPPPASAIEQVTAISGMTNSINGDAYLGGEANTWKCQGVSAELLYETAPINGVMTEIGYWSITVELLYRQSGWNLKLPDVGFNFIDSGQKRRAMVFDFQNSEWVPSPGPVGLNGQGGLTLGAPAILNRRVYLESDFTTAFGSPPT